MSSLYGFVYSRASLEYLESLTSKIRRQIAGRISALALDPFPHGYKQLKGTDPDEEAVYRIRSGDYRVLYVVRDNPQCVVILDIDHRKDVYR